MGNKSVDIIIPCYNGALYLPQTIDSVLAQTCQSINVFVVDDGSTDNTRDVVNSCSGRIGYFYQENRGQAAARNCGLSKTSSDYVCLLDADDIILPDMIKTQVEYLERHPECDICHSRTLAFSNRNIRHPYAETWRPFGPWQDYLEPLSVICAIHLGSAVIRRRAFESYGEFPEDRSIQGCEDWHFWLQSVHRGAVIGHIPRVHSLYRQHLSSASGQLRSIMNRECELMKRAAEMFDTFRVHDARRRRILSYGIKFVATTCHGLRETARFDEMIQLSNKVVHEPAGLDNVDRAFGLADQSPRSLLYLALSQGFLDLNLPDLAAVMFLHAGDARKAARRSGELDVFNAVARKMEDLVARNRTSGQQAWTSQTQSIKSDDKSVPNETCNVVNLHAANSYYFELDGSIPHDASIIGHVQHHLALLSKERKRIKDAEARLVDAIGLNPYYMRPHLDLLLLLIRKGNFGAAKSEYKRIKELDAEFFPNALIDLVVRFAEHRLRLDGILAELRKRDSYNKLTRLIRNLISHAAKPSRDANGSAR